MLLLTAAMALLWAHPAACLDQSFTVDGDIRHFVVAADTVYVATGEMMYQLSPELSPVQTVIQRGEPTGSGEHMRFIRDPEARRGSATFSVNVLLPFVKNGTVISCGMIGNVCYSEVLDSKNISRVLYKEDVLVGPARARSASVAFLVDVQKTSPETYIMTAIQQQKETSSAGACSSRSEAAYLHSTNNGQIGGIFSVIDVSSSALFKKREGVNFVDFVDGFQMGQVIYLFSNVDSRVRLIWLESVGSKLQTFTSMRGASLQVSGRLLASSVLPDGAPVLWSGVFSVEGGEYNTELLLFDITADLTGGPDRDPDFCALACSQATQKPKTLNPKATLFRQNNMTSVLAVRRRTWMVFYIGTGDGQLIKLSVDKNYRTTCPTLLYKFSDDRQVFPRIYLDEVGKKHVFAAFGNQVRRVPVSNCSAHKSLEECWSARDPDCVWCGGDRSSCVFEDECEGSDWLSYPEVYRPKMISFSVARGSGGQITLSAHTHLSAGQGALANFACQISGPTRELCSRASPRPQFPQCTCILSNSTIPAEGLTVAAKIRLGATNFQDRIILLTCTDISGPPTSDLCQRCIEAGCDWINGGCSWSTGREIDDSVCQSTTQTNFTKPKISSITPSVVSFFGKNHAVLSGYNLSHVIRVRINTAMGCVQQESPVWNNTGVNLTFHIPRADNKGIASVCLLLSDGSCHGNAKVTYVSAPSCDKVTPNRTWMSGKRVITLTGTYLDISEGILHSHVPRIVTHAVSVNPEEVTYLAPAAENVKEFLTSTVLFKVVNESMPCPTALTYYPDPKFTKYTSTQTGRDVKITIQKKVDKLEMSEKELVVWGVRQGVEYPCEMEPKDTNNKTEFFACVIKNIPNSNFEHVKIMYGETTVILVAPSAQIYFLMLLIFLLIPAVVIAVVIFYRSKQKKLATKMNTLMENLELDIRNDIRQGFVDLQTEKTDLMENVGTIPFLDYKHFASRIFFPENDTLMALCVTDIGQVATKVELDDSCHGLSRLLQDQLFLTSMVHALEAEKSFTIKDKCTLASLLTVALHGNLSYLTEVMETLLKALMQQKSNTQPKLLLRRTESTVEKLLTNWMSICLYGFLRESVGQHLFLMVSALTQQITKGPVDCVTEKALYTLSEDWLLWQAQEFCSVRLNVLFAVGSEGEVSEPLEVNALDCDTVEQVKEKILTTFKAKFGFHFDSPLKEVSIEYERDGSFVALQEVDASSEVIGEVKMLNTLKHYKVSDGAKIKVLSKKTHPPLTSQRSVRDDENFSGKYFHLIDPDVDEHQRQSPERKKLKVKEVHLTKLLSTKVAVHSFVETLFRSIWGVPQCRAQHAVKYFFDFLDAQAENMKITDPEVLHIWKTNSLPLRFWINILKNPQFVFDMEKTPHLDGCLSVIAQAFMDSFSLSEMQLGKHAPTNKLLYAKDIPKFKQEVKTYYKQIREQSTITDSDFKVFLQEESKKHENEFNEAAALKEIFKYVQKYFNEILEKLDQNGAPTELTEQLHHIKKLFDGHKSAAWS